MQKKQQRDYDEMIGRCLAAFVQAGTLELSLDQLATTAGTTKRMLVHYFGSKVAIEERAMTLLEEHLRAQFTPDQFAKNTSFVAVVDALWKQTSAPESRGVLLLIMDLSRRAWNGSERAQRFYAEQQRLWVELLLHFTNNKAKVEEVLQLFQGAVLAFLITGDAERGESALRKLASSRRRAP
jgi:AcrR family transcriptional regulator